ncbi:TIGR04076 family protein [Alkaliphilus transvaalensis]|uniref:TIGR04076 family protein n=1 Tax=Alkaliphilus transvaalensis TaxID=114628 RepID=UPI00047CF9B8
MKVKLTVLESKCRGNFHKVGDIYEVIDICPPICHELWQSMYPSIYTLLNNGDLDYGNTRSKEFKMRCPDNGRVLIRGEIIDDCKY